MMKRHIYANIEICILNAIIHLLSRVERAGWVQLFFRRNFVLFGGMELLWTGLMISGSCFLGLISGYFFYTMMNVAR